MTTQSLQETPSSEASQPAALPVAHSRFLYVIHQGSYVRVAGSRILVTRDDQTLLETPAHKLQGVLVFGNVQVTMHCIAELLDAGVWLSFFSRTGRYRGRLEPPNRRGGVLRRLQYERSLDGAYTVRVARAFVRAKLLGQKQIIQAYSKNYPAESFGSGHETIVSSLAKVEAAGRESLRGIEGTATRAYFDIFRRLNRSSFPFEGRAKHPPRDPINALLSMGYSMLTRELEGMIESAGFDPAVGFYHLPDRDRPSLACDWIEEFRHTIVDRMVLGIINRRMLEPRHFQQHEHDGIRLQPEGLKRFIEVYESTMNGRDTDPYPSPGAARTLLLRQLALLYDSILRGEPYLSHFDGSAAASDCTAVSVPAL